MKMMNKMNQGLLLDVSFPKLLLFILDYFDEMKINEINKMKKENFDEHIEREKRVP